VVAQKIKIYHHGGLYQKDGERAICYMDLKYSTSPWYLRTPCAASIQ